jgi:hypothetical protein
MHVLKNKNKNALEPTVPPVLYFEKVYSDWQKKGITSFEDIYNLVINGKKKKKVVDRITKKEIEEDDNDILKGFEIV